jgi:hypothetical protein
MSASEDLLRLAPPPGGEPEPPPVDWARLESSLGASVPSDYKWLVEAYGPGTFDHFLYVLQPESVFEPLQLVRSARDPVFQVCPRRPRRPQRPGG